MTVNVVDSAIARLQDIALACTSVTIKSAPDYPIENIDPLPMVVTRLIRGENAGGSAGFFTFLPVVEVDFLFSRSSLKQAFNQADLIALEYNKRLSGDPTLSAIIDTLNFPISFAISFVTWDKTPCIQLAFTIKFKTLENTQATA